MNATPLVVDSLGFLPDPFDPTTMRAGGVIAAPSLEAVDAAQRSGLVATNMTLAAGADYQATLDVIAECDDVVSASGGKLRKVLNAADIDAARESGAVGLIYGFQNSAMLETDLSRIAQFYDLGVRIIQLTYNDQNQVGSGSLAPSDTGLTEFGRDVLATLNEKRIIVDLSHGSYQLTMDVAAASTAERPPSITHTGCAALSATPRNKTDEELRAIAELGGYVGIYTMPFLALGRNYEYSDFFAHVDHAVNVCGEDAIGIGTDQGVCDLGDPQTVRENYAASVRARREAGISAPGEDPDILPYPIGFEGPEKYRQIEQALREGGYGSARIEKILGENFVRYAQKIWGE